MIYQAYIDESITKNGIFLLGGAIASVDQWAAFNEDWVPLVQSHGLMDMHGNRYFKMSEMALTGDRRSKIIWFYAALERHVQGLLSCSFNLTDLAEAQERIIAPGLNLNWEKFGSPYILAIRAMLDMFHTVDRKALAGLGLPENAVVDFWFDERSESKQILNHWDSYLEIWSPEVRSRFGKRPRFESDDQFPPLQGADLWAWWARKYEQQCDDPMPQTTLPFEKRPKWLAMTQSQEDLVNIMAQLVSRRHPGQSILDKKNGQLIKVR